MLLVPGQVLIRGANTHRAQLCPGIVSVSFQRHTVVEGAAQDNQVFNPLNCASQDNKIFNQLNWLELLNWWLVSFLPIVLTNVLIRNVSHLQPSTVTQRQEILVACRSSFALFLLYRRLVVVYKADDYDSGGCKQELVPLFQTQSYWLQLAKPINLKNWFAEERMYLGYFLLFTFSHNDRI